ncbi:MAG: molecular chaperone HtpG [Simkaniaceae bacterium]|nr:molecular chaperone HtpG [Simkaniaceae bacterium]
MSEKNLRIHSENILPIIKKWLYTDRDIFLRELVSNACDAIGKMRILRDQGKVDVKDEEFRIDVDINTGKKEITITDTGIGMTEEEVEKYIAQLAFSGAEEFVDKYRSKGENHGIIGHFGLGFYSAFMVSDRVEIDTLSFEKGAEPVFWSCDGSSSYVTEKGTRETRGTVITLHLSQEEGKEFADEGRLRAILLKHCRFLPYPIYLNGKRINDKEPLWIDAPSDLTDKAYIDFYRTLYPLEPDPVFWIHLNVDYPFSLQGILYFPKLNRRLDPDMPSIHLYCNRVFVSDYCKEVIPEHFSMLRGVIDSPDIPLNVSRSNLQTDPTVKKAGAHISKKIADRLLSLYESDPDRFMSKFVDIEPVMKIGLLRDEKFYERVKPCLIWKTSKEERSTIEEYLERNKGKGGGTVFYHHDQEDRSPLVDMYGEKGIEIVYTSCYLDIPVMSFLEGKLPNVKFKRLDGTLEEAILDKSRERNVLDASGKTEAAVMADFIRHKLDKKEVEVEAKSLTSDEVPAFVVIREEMRRVRDYMALSGQKMPTGSEGGYTFVVNTNSELIRSITKIGERDPALAKEMVLDLYERSLLAQKELDPEAVPGFLRRSNEVLRKLSARMAEQVVDQTVT